jgi:uncharacterized membrane protein YheB (UPF0754 family)
MELIYFAPPLLGSFIGYVTNVVAVKLLFHPKKPYYILGFKIQGLVPARSKEIIDRVMDSISELLTKEDFEFIIERAITRTYIESKVKEKIDQIFENPVLSFILKTIGKSEITEKLSASISDYIENFIKEIISKNIANNIDIREFIAKKAEEVSDEEIESIFNKFAKKELRFIEVSGAVLGFFIGLIQSGLFFLFG